MLYLVMTLHKSSVTLRITISLVKQSFKSFEKESNYLIIISHIRELFLRVVESAGWSHYLNEVFLSCILFEMPRYFHIQLKILKMALNKKVEITGHFLEKTKPVYQIITPALVDLLLN